LACSCANRSNGRSSATSPVTASNRPSTRGTGSEFPARRWRALSGNALRFDRVSGASVPDPSTSSVRCPRQTVGSPPPPPPDSAARSEAAPSRSRAWTAATGRRARASQYAAALTVTFATCRSARIATFRCSIWSTIRWTVAAGPSFRSRHACPASRHAASIAAGGRCGSRSSLIRRSARETLTIRGLLRLG